MQVNHTSVTITSGPFAARVVAGELLTVTGLTDDGCELLACPAELPPAYRVHGRAAGITLLHPWANRLGGDHYAVGDVRADIADEPGVARVGRDRSGLPIHGLLGSRPWEFTGAGRSACRARLIWDADPGFPFSHVVEVSFAFDGGELSITTTTSPVGTGLVPVAHGWHPYFRADRASGVQVTLPARTELALTADGLPTGETRTRDRLELNLTDEDWDDAAIDLPDGAEAVLRTGGRRICVRTDRGYPCSHVFAPRDAPVVSIEPMTAPVDGLRSGAVAWATPGTPHIASFAVLVAGC